MLHRSRRCELVRCSDLDVLRTILERFMPATLVLDLEPMILAWDASGDELSDALSRIGNALGWAQDPRMQVVIVSNSTRILPRSVSISGDEVTVIGRAAKPWRPTILATHPKPILIVGDQVVTDGILAWRLGAAFVHWQLSERAPLWPTFQSKVGCAVERLLFAQSATEYNRWTE